MSGAVVWQTRPIVLAGNVEAYGKNVIQALHLLADHFAAVLEAAAKANAPWTDRTAAARQGLTGLAVKAATGVTLYLFHTVFYGIFLELKNAGRYAVIMRTMESNHAAIMGAARKLVGG